MASTENLPEDVSANIEFIRAAFEKMESKVLIEKFECVVDALNTRAPSQWWLGDGDDRAPSQRWLGDGDVRG